MNSSPFFAYHIAFSLQTMVGSSLEIMHGSPSLPHISRACVKSSPKLFADSFAVFTASAKGVGGGWGWGGACARPFSFSLLLYYIRDDSRTASPHPREKMSTWGSTAESSGRVHRIARLAADGFCSSTLYLFPTTQSGGARCESEDPRMILPHLSPTPDIFHGGCDTFVLIGQSEVRCLV